MQRSILAKRAWLVLFIAISIFYLWGLGTLPFVGPDEPRYAQVAREMIERRDLITPTLGGMPWFEKPPLLYWLMMFSYRLLGVNEYAARLGPALCGLLTAGFLWWIGRNVQDRDADAGNSIGCWSALAWLSSAGAIGFSRAASFDIVLTMTITGAFAFLLAHEVRLRRNLLFGFYLFAGLSVLAKGLIGLIIIAGVITLYYIVRRERPAATFLKSLLWGIPLAVIVAAIWFVPMFMRHGRVFFDQFIIQHHFARFVSNKYHHPGPIYFYLPVVIGLALPWTIVLGGALASARKWSWRGSGPLDRLKVFALVWLILPVAFFSVSGSKLVAYVLPVLPAIALLAGERIACVLNAGRGRRLLQITGLILVILAFGGHWYLTHRTTVSADYVALTVFPLYASGAAALLLGKLRPLLFALIAVAAITTSTIALSCVAPQVARKESVRDLLKLAKHVGYGDVPVVQLHVVERAAEFYAAGRLLYGPDGEPVKFESVLQVVGAAKQNERGLVLCFVPIEYQWQLLSFGGAKSEVIASNGSVALIAVRPSNP